MANYGEQITEEFQRNKLEELLTQCSSEQQAFFKRLYPKGVTKSNLCQALSQCQATIVKNAKLATVL